MKSSARLLRIVFLTGVVLLIFSSLTQTTQAPSVAAGLMGTSCSPLPAPETLRVNPVTSPTQALTQTVGVRWLEHGTEIDIISEAGVKYFTGTFAVDELVSITIPLSPTMVHHLTVAGQVQYPPCDYMLYTMHDINGGLLTIQQLGLNNRLFLPIVLRW